MKNTFRLTYSQTSVRRKLDSVPSFLKQPLIHKFNLIKQPPSLTFNVSVDWLLNTGLTVI